MTSEWCAAPCAQDHSCQKVPGLRPGTRGLGGMNECAQEPGQEHCRHPSLSQGARGLGGMAECAGCLLNRLSSRIAMVLQGHCSRLLRALIKTAAVLQARPSRCRGPSGSAQKGRSSRRSTSAATVCPLLAPAQPTSHLGPSAFRPCGPPIFVPSRPSGLWEPRSRPAG